jgi:hypothetical protein
MTPDPISYVLRLGSISLAFRKKYCQIQLANYQQKIPQDI